MSGTGRTEGRPALTLRPLTAVTVGGIEHWFDHAEVQRRLGDRSWIHRERHLIGERPGSTFRGMTVLRSYGWVAYDPSGRPVAYVGGDVYDRWVTYHGERPDGPLLSGEDPRVSMALTYLVDPARLRQGHGRAAITIVLARSDLGDVRAFYCGIDADNHASRRCAASAGFELLDSNPDFEDIVYYRCTR